MIRWTDLNRIPDSCSGYVQGKCTVSSTPAVFNEGTSLSQGGTGSFKSHTFA
jgi:hypothetical protein